MRKLPLVAVILLNWNRLEETSHCLESLKRLYVTGFRLMVIVVDNGSRSNPTQLIRRVFRAAVVIRSDRNLGFAGGNNLGIRYALKSGADYVWLLNNDTIVAPNSLRELVRKYQISNPPAGRAGSKYQILSPVIFELERGEKKTRRVQFAGGMIDWLRGTGRPEGGISNKRSLSSQGSDRRSFSSSSSDKRSLSSQGSDNKLQITNGVQETGFVPGTAMLVARVVFERIGYLDERYFAYNEDTDFCFRAKKAGIQIGLVPPAHIWHKLATSSGPKSALFWYLNCRNKWLFMKAHAKAWHWPFFVLHYLWKPLLFRLLAVIARPSSENRLALVAALRGTKDGLIARTGRPPARLLPLNLS